MANLKKVMLKKARQKKSNTVWFHLCKILENINWCIMTERGCLGMGRGGRDRWMMDYKRAWANFQGDRYVHYLDCGDGFRSVYMYQHSPNGIYHVKYVQFIVHQLYFNNKAVGGEGERERETERHYSTWTTDTQDVEEIINNTEWR